MASPTKLCDMLAYSVLSIINISIYQSVNVIEQNKSELANIKFQIKPNKRKNFLFFYCFEKKKEKTNKQKQKPSTACTGHRGKNLLSGSIN